MSESQQTTPDILPKPQIPSAAEVNSAHGSSIGTEQQLSQPEIQPITPPPANATVLQAQQVANDASTQQSVAIDDPANPAVATVASTMPQIADDVDLIEKEWIHKAKHIVEQTKQDPYQQNKEMTKVKADYQKKRYNRDVQVD
jgi:hypothetical protein